MTPTPPEAPVPIAPASKPRIQGKAIVYRFCDVGYEIHLDRVADLLASSAPNGRTRCAARRRPSTSRTPRSA